MSKDGKVFYSICASSLVSILLFWVIVFGEKIFFSIKNNNFYFLSLSDVLFVIFLVWFSWSVCSFFCLIIYFFLVKFHKPNFSSVFLSAITFSLLMMVFLTSNNLLMIHYLACFLCSLVGTVLFFKIEKMRCSLY